MWSYLPQLDGLRAIAVYLVLVYHATHVPHGPTYAAGGFVGVDLFFVLSGFLVTNVILSEVDRHGRFSLGGFYARRVRLLLPAAVLVVVATMVAFVVVSDVVRRLEMIGDARSALLYYANWHFLAQSTDYFSADLAPSPFLHFWSLAIEEQYYVLFPVLVAVLLRLRRNVASRLGLVCAVLLVGSITAQLYWGHHEPNHAYYGTDARLYQLLAGVLLALALRHSTRWFESSTGAAAMLAGLTGLLLVASGLVDLSPTWRGLGATAASVALIGSLTVLPRAWLGRVLARPVPVYLGKISYGTYLWHWPVILVLREVLTVGPNTIAVFAFVLSSALAALSYQVYEMPIRTNKRLVAIRWPVVVAGVTSSALVAAFVVAPVLQTDRRPALASFAAGTGSAAAAAARSKVPGDGPVPTGVDFRKAVKDRGHSTRCSATDTAACMVVPDNGPLVLLVGDSFANMVGPMFVKLAHEHHFSLAENIVEGCPWPDDLADFSQNAGLRADCAKARDGFYAAALRDLKPALVILLMRPRDKKPSYWAPLMRSRSGRLSGDSLSRLLYTTMSDTVQQLRAGGAEVLMIQSVMDANPERPLDCLARATRLSQCAVPYPLRPIPSDGYMQALSAASNGVFTTSINPVVCPTPPFCVPYRDGQIVFRDRHHIMTTFALAERAKIWRLLVASGATGAL